MPKNDIKEFIDFFHDAALRIRKEKAKFTRGKDGKLVQLALNKFSREQLEMLATWFLHKKRKLSPTIGAMLSQPMLEELQETLKKPTFWRDLDEIQEKFYAKNSTKR